MTNHFNNDDRGRQPVDTPARGGELSSVAKGGNLVRATTVRGIALYDNWLPRLALRLQLVLADRREAFQRAVLLEREMNAPILWAPVFFGIGCVIYFNLPTEPLAAAFPLVAVLSLLAARRLAFGTGLRDGLMALFMMCLGVSVAQWHTRNIDTQMLPRTIVAQISGVVERAEHRADGRVRYTINISGAHGSLDAYGIKQPPERIRLTARKGGPEIDVGDVIAGRARVGPSPGPAYPGAYDFSFQNWFSGIGGSGFFLGAPKAVPVVSTDNNSIGLWVGRMRGNISNLIRDALPGNAGGLAAALIIGDRSGIDEETAEALRKSGLAHILAISGLHMALVSATVIFLLRATMAAVPSLALYYPIRKWAAGGALIAASIYLLMSGASVSTQRAYIMVAIMLCAVLADRRALSMRNVAVAALAVLALTPHAVLGPGFQMSFAAVAALIATYESITRWNHNRDRASVTGIYGAIRRFLIRDMGGLALTSLVAGLATGLFAAYHFHRVAPYGLLANLIAMPLVSLAVMPLALLSVLAMPFGLEAWPLGLLASALEPVVNVASWVGALEPAGHTGIISVQSLLFGVCALLLVTLLRSRLRWLAVPVLVSSVLFARDAPVPDLLVLENGAQIAVHDDDGELRLLRPNAEKFSTEIWRRAFAPQSLSNIVRAPRGAPGKGYQCDNYGCATQTNGRTIVHLKSTAELEDDCTLADVLIIPFDMPNACSFLPAEQRPVVIDRLSLQKRGAHAVHFDVKRNGNKHLLVETAYSSRSRPWTKHRNNQ